MAFNFSFSVISLLSNLLNMVKCIYEVVFQMTAVLQVFIKEMLVACMSLAIVKLFSFGFCGS